MLNLPTISHNLFSHFISLYQYLHDWRTRVLNTLLLLLSSADRSTILLKILLTGLLISAVNAHSPKGAHNNALFTKMAQVFGLLKNHFRLLISECFTAINR